MIYVVIWLSACCCLPSLAFVSRLPYSPSVRMFPTSVATQQQASSSDNDEAPSTTEVVLFGLGDLRVDDHVGLHRALAAVSACEASQVLPICILNGQSLAQFPGSMAHTESTAHCIHAALTELDQELSKEARLSDLQVILSENPQESLTDCLEKVIASTNNSNSNSKVRVHVCDLGPADNQMGYGPKAQLLQSCQSLDTETMELVSWTQDLRSQPWDQVASLPINYNDYERQFVQNRAVTEPINNVHNDNNKNDQSGNANNVPLAEDVLRALSKAVSTKSCLHAQDEGRIEAEASSGLYLTHWGGVDPASTIGCRSASNIVKAYTSDCDQNDLTWLQHALYPGRPPIMERNGNSLEHAAIMWQLEGDGTSPFGKPDNLLAGETMVRFLAAPLLLGTISPRRLWHESQKSQSSMIAFVPPVQRMVEVREWHNLLAARNMACEPEAYAVDQREKNDNSVYYRYWRYQGFLCRYAVKPMTEKDEKKDGMLLVHGFGASGTQWNKAMDSMEQEQKNQETQQFDEGLAPDLLGFGQAEKPAISYTGYLWDSQVLDFVKECAVPNHDWSSFVVGGNSIGGFTSMSMAASDMATVAQMSSRENICVNSNGAPGSNMCQGLVLMNSAGPVKTRDEIQNEKEEAQRAMEQDPKKKLPQYSIAQVTAMNALPLCQPPWRPVARGFGNVLLSYLRPNIQSICVNLYPTNPDAVDDDLCEAIERDSLDPGAINVMMAGAKLPVPRTANELLNGDFRMGLQHDSEEARRGDIQESVFGGPVLIAQGVLDPLNDAQDRLERFGGLRRGITMDPIQAGHCPHDEVPELVAQSILRWTQKTKSGASTEKVEIQKSTMR